MARTHIGIIGAGNMGTAFPRRLGAAGHEIAIAATKREHAERAAAAAGDGARAVPHEAIAQGADVIILATPYGAAANALRGAGDLNGKVVIDITNPLAPNMSGLTVGHTTSAGEEIQQAVPGAKVVKAFNTIFANILGGAGMAQVFYAGDDAGAKDAVRELIESAGFDAVDAGPLANARYLEPLGMLTIFLGYAGGRGTGIAPAFVPVV